MTALNSTPKRAKGFKLPSPKILGIAGGIIVFLIIFGVIGVFIPLTKLTADAQVLKGTARNLKDAAATQDLDALRNSLQTLSGNLTTVQKDYSAFGWAQVIPFASAYYRDGEHSLKAAVAGTDAGIKTVEAVYPYAGKIGLKTANTEAFGSMKEKVAALLTAMPEISPSLGNIQLDVNEMNTELQSVDYNRYPSGAIKGINIRDLLKTAKETSQAVATAFPDIKQAFIDIPPAFGAGNTTKNYVLIFQNDKELRPTGGFWTAYALVTFKNGQLIDIKSSDMYNLDSQIGLYNHPAPPPFFKGFLDVDYFYARDVNISPDFVVSAAKFQDFWKLAGQPKVDGVWALDTYVLQELLHDLGKVEISGYTEAFDETNVVDQMETYANILLREQAGRKNLIGELMNSIMQKAFSASQKEYPTLIASGIKLLEQKHVLISFNDPAAEALAEKYNLAGRLQPFAGDYLHVNDANLGGRKANWFVTEQIAKEVQSQGGQLTSKVTINYQNPGVYNTDWNTGYKDVVRVYVPAGSTLLSSSGSVTPVTTANDLGKTYFTASVLVVPAGGTATLTFDYTIPSSVVSNGQYSLLMQKEPGTEGIPVDLKISGKSQKLTLDTDKTVTQKI